LQGKRHTAKAASFIGLSRADELSHIRDALDRVGLLLTTGAGTRVTPDLLADHLAYTACYDNLGQSRTFSTVFLLTLNLYGFARNVRPLFVGSQYESLALSVWCQLGYGFYGLGLDSRVYSVCMNTAGDFSERLSKDEVLVVIWRTQDIRDGMRTIYNRLLGNGQIGQCDEVNRVNMGSAKLTNQLPEPIHRFRSKVGVVDGGIPLLK